MANDASTGKRIVKSVDQATTKEITPIDAGEIVEKYRYTVVPQNADNGLGDSVGIVAFGLILAQGFAMGKLHMDRCLDAKAFNTVPDRGHGLSLGDVCVRDDGKSEEAFASNHKI